VDGVVTKRPQVSGDLPRDRLVHEELQLTTR
jgi:hypothetical protein